MNNKFIRCSSASKDGPGSYRYIYAHDEAIFFEQLHISENEVKSQGSKQESLDVSARLKSFVEVVQNCAQDMVLNEPKRCFSCGNCFECDACYKICPVKAITKLDPGKRYKIDIEKMPLGKRAIITAYMKNDYKGIKDYEDRLFGKAQEYIALSDTDGNPLFTDDAAKALLAKHGLK